MFQERQATCLWRCSWKGIANQKGEKIAEGGAVYLKATFNWQAIVQLTGGLAQIFGGECRFWKGIFSIIKTESNSPLQLGEAPIENALPKLKKIYSNFPKAKQ